jgi:hypothetical protein
MLEAASVIDNERFDIIHLKINVLCGLQWSSDVSISLQTAAMIMGEKLAPWEDPRTSQVILKPLGNLRSIVLALLERDASVRMTMAEAHSACRRLLGNTTITGQN